MPIYEYECSACGRQTEQWQKISEEPLLECSHCGKFSLQRIISATGFQLKGTGWYVTDFRDKGKKSADNKTEPVTEKVETKDSNSPKEEIKTKEDSA